MKAQEQATEAAYIARKKEREQRYQEQLRDWNNPESGRSFQQANEIEARNTAKVTAYAEALKADAERRAMPVTSRDEEVRDTIQRDRSLYDDGEDLSSEDLREGWTQFCDWLQKYAPGVQLSERDVQHLTRYLQLNFMAKTAPALIFAFKRLKECGTIGGQTIPQPVLEPQLTPPVLEEEPRPEREPEVPNPYKDPVTGQVTDKVKYDAEDKKRAKADHDYAVYVETLKGIENANLLMNGGQPLHGTIRQEILAIASTNLDFNSLSDGSKIRGIAESLFRDYYAPKYTLDPAFETDPIEKANARLAAAVKSNDFLRGIMQTAPEPTTEPDAEFVATQEKEKARLAKLAEQAALAKLSPRGRQAKKWADAQVAANKVGAEERQKSIEQDEQLRRQIREEAAAIEKAEYDRSPAGLAEAKKRQAEEVARVEAHNQEVLRRRKLWREGKLAV